MNLVSFLAQYQYRPFVTPLPLWDEPYWAFLLFPLCLAIAIVYKCVRCDSMRRVPREAIGLFFVILIVMALTAGALAAVVNVLD